MKVSKITILLVLCFIGSTAIIVLLYRLSDDQARRRNNFIRRFEFNPTEAGMIDLKVNSYYFAGSDQNRIFLGNFTAPLLVTELDAGLSEKKEFRINLEKRNLPFQAPQTRILPPYFYLVDGTVPVVYKGLVADRKAKIAWQGTTAFNHFELMDTEQLTFTAIDNSSGETVLGTLDFGTTPTVNTTRRLLEKQIDGVFDVDGTLRYDHRTGRLVYTYYYRNQYIVSAPDLKLLFRGKTIDTTTQAKIQISYIASHREQKMKAPPLVVNQSTALYKNLLLVNSRLPGKYEPLDMWQDANIIDVYDLSSGAYVVSFYIYNIGKEKLRSFFVHNDHFYGFIGNHLVRYKLTKALLKEADVNKIQASIRANVENL